MPANWINDLAALCQVTVRLSDCDFVHERQGDDEFVTAIGSCDPPARGQRVGQTDTLSVGPRQRHGRLDPQATQSAQLRNRGHARACSHECGVRDWGQHSTFEL